MKIILNILVSGILFSVSSNLKQCNQQYSSTQCDIYIYNISKGTYELTVGKIKLTPFSTGDPILHHGNYLGNFFMEKDELYFKYFLTEDKYKLEKNSFLEIKFRDIYSDRKGVFLIDMSDFEEGLIKGLIIGEGKNGFGFSTLDKKIIFK